MSKHVLMFASVLFEIVLEISEIEQKREQKDRKKETYTETEKTG